MSIAEDTLNSVYHPLPQDGNGWMRLLRLRPGGWFDPLTCSLSAHRREDIGHNYIALSYVWGGRSQDRYLTIDSTSTGHTHTEITSISALLPITDNLFTALRRIRAIHGTSSPVWADAICINQASNTEKSQQVAAMGSTYRDAGKIFCWLGEKQEKDSMNQDFDLRFLNSIDAAFYESHRHDASSCSEHYDGAVDDEDDRDDWMSHVVSDILGQTLHLAEWTAFTTAHHQKTPAYSRALLRLANNPYFTRQWIQQEVCLGWDAATAYLGDRGLSLYCLYRHLVGLDEFLKSTAAAVLLSDHHMSQLSLNLGNTISFLLSGLPGQLESRNLRDWLESCNDLGCGMLQDKVFGLLSVAHEGEELKRNFNWPNYGLAPPTVYAQAATHLVLHSLAAPGMILDNVFTEPRMRGLPSWVPDWSQPAASLVHKLETLKWIPQTPASTARVTRESRADGDRYLLHLPGMSVGKSLSMAARSISGESVSALEFDESSASEIWETLVCWWQLASENFSEKDGIGPGGREPEAAFSDLLLTSRLAASESSRRAVELLRNSAAADVSKIEAEAKSRNPPKEALAWIEEVWRRNHGSRLAILDVKEFSRKDIAILPQDARTGDTLAILSGADAVCVLRPTSNSRDDTCRFRLVGFARLTVTRGDAIFDLDPAEGLSEDEKREWDPERMATFAEDEKRRFLLPETFVLE